MSINITILLSFWKMFNQDFNIVSWIRCWFIKIEIGDEWYNLEGTGHTFPKEAIMALVRPILPSNGKGEMYEQKNKDYDICGLYTLDCGVCTNYFDKGICKKK